MTHFDRTLWRQ